MKQIWLAFKMFLILTIITGVIYPLLVTGIAQALFPRQSNASLVKVHNQTIGSALIGQKFTSPCYFWSRPSVGDYSPLPSGGSNLGPTSALLKKQIAQRQDHLALANGKSDDEVPKDLLFASGSGLDPHISPEAALFQTDRVARARNLDKEGCQKLMELIDLKTEGRDLRFLGESRVNVLLLNVAVDSVFGEVHP
jgi:K+-transporting ATPase ATPase C chain